VAARTANSTSLAREKWPGRKHGLALFALDQPGASPPATSSVNNHTQLEKRKSLNFSGVGESSNTASSTDASTPIPESRPTSFSSLLLGSSGDSNSSPGPGFSRGLSEVSRTSSEAIPGGRSLPSAASESLSALKPTAPALKPTAPALNGSTALSSGGGADARPAMGRSTALSSEGGTDARPSTGTSTALSEDGVADAGPAFAHQLVPFKFFALGHLLPISKGACSAFKLGGHRSVELSQAAHTARIKEALLRRGIQRAEILHDQFRGSEGAGAPVRGDDELSRVHLAEGDPIIPDNSYRGAGSWCRPLPCDEVFRTAEELSPETAENSEKIPASSKRVVREDSVEGGYPSKRIRCGTDSAGG
ncbi:unnamed protein product, partial [Laminaria digitata]